MAGFRESIQTRIKATTTTAVIKKVEVKVSTTDFAIIIAKASVVNVSTGPVLGYAKIKKVRGQTPHITNVYAYSTQSSTLDRSGRAKFSLVNVNYPKINHTSISNGPILGNIQAVTVAKPLIAVRPILAAAAAIIANLRLDHAIIADFAQIAQPVIKSIGYAAFESARLIFLSNPQVASAFGKLPNKNISNNIAVIQASKTIDVLKRSQSSFSTKSNIPIFDVKAVRKTTFSTKSQVAKDSSKSLLTDLIQILDKAAVRSTHKNAISTTALQSVVVVLLVRLEHVLATVNLTSRPAIGPRKKELVSAISNFNLIYIKASLNKFIHVTDEGVVKKTTKGTFSTLGVSSKPYIGPRVESLLATLSKTKFTIGKPRFAFIKTDLDVIKHIYKNNSSSTRVTTKLYGGRRVQHFTEISANVIKHVYKNIPLVAKLQIAINKDVVKGLQVSSARVSSKVYPGRNFRLQASLNAIVTKYVTKRNSSVPEVVVDVFKVFHKKSKSNTSIISNAVPGRRIKTFASTNITINKYVIKSTFSTAATSTDTSKIVRARRSSSPYLISSIIKGNIQNSKTGLNAFRVEKTAKRRITSDYFIKSDRPFFSVTTRPKPSIPVTVSKVLTARRNFLKVNFNTLATKKVKRELQTILDLKSLRNILIQKPVSNKVEVASNTIAGKAVHPRDIEILVSKAFLRIIRKLESNAQTKVFVEKRPNKFIKNIFVNNSKTLVAYAAHPRNIVNIRISRNKFINKNLFVDNLSIKSLPAKKPIKIVTNTTTIQSNTLPAYAIRAKDILSILLEHTKYIKKPIDNKSEVQSKKTLTVGKNIKDTLSLINGVLIAYSRREQLITSAISDTTIKPRKNIDNIVQLQAESMLRTIGKTVANDTLSLTNSGTLIIQNYATDYFYQDYVGDVRELS
jgi:hypothetical protein|tara:strand:+ start:2516 stop:5239 length:2724 start_codon:yes stop_codon:yes gene_type:complete